MLKNQLLINYKSLKRKGLLCFITSTLMAILVYFMTLDLVKKILLPYYTVDHDAVNNFFLLRKRLLVWLMAGAGGGLLLFLKPDKVKALINFLTEDYRVKSFIKKLFRVIFITMTYAIISAIVLNIFMATWGLRVNSQIFGFHQMITYSAHRPFAFRVLTPTVINIISWFAPVRYKSHANLKSGHARGLEQEKQKEAEDSTRNNRYTAVIRNKYDLSDGYDTEQLITYFYLFGVLLVLIFSLRYLTNIVYSYSPLFIDFAPVIAFLLLPLTFMRGGYIYDFPELLLTVLCLIFLIKGKFFLYYLFFILAILNKESNILLIIYFISFNLKNMPRKYFYYHLLFHLILGLSLVAFTRMVFTFNPGSGMEFQLFGNILFYLDIKTYFSVTDIYSPFIFVPKTVHILSLFILAFVVFYRWDNKPTEVKRSFLLMSGALIPLFIVGGYLDEVRNLSLDFPAVYLLACHTFHRLYPYNAICHSDRREKSVSSIYFYNKISRRFAPRNDT